MVNEVVARQRDHGRRRRERGRRRCATSCAVARRLARPRGPTQQIAGTARTVPAATISGHVVTGVGLLDDGGDGGVAAPPG